METLRKSFGVNIQTQQFIIGRRYASKSIVPTLLQPLLDAFRLAGHIIIRQPDIVHINPSLNSKSILRDGLFLLALRLIGKRRVLMFIHGWDEELARRIELSAWRRKLFRFVFGWPQIIVVLASQFKNYLLNIGFPAEGIRVEPTFFDGELFEGCMRTTHPGHRLIFLSRLVREKGIWELVRAYAALKPRYPDISLDILGDGPEKADLQQWIMDNHVEGIRLPGYITGKDKAQHLVDSDLFVFPTYYGEGCPVSLLEAMAAGLPCITTRAGGISDVIEDSVNGLLLDTVSDDSVRRALEELMCDSARMAHMGDINKTQAWTRYESHIAADRMIRMYQDILDHARA